MIDCLICSFSLVGRFFQVWMFILEIFGVELEIVVQDLFYMYYFVIIFIVNIFYFVVDD